MQHSGLCAPPLSWHLPSPFVFCWLIVNKYQMRSPSLPDSATQGTVGGTEYLLAPTGQSTCWLPRLAACLLQSWLLAPIWQCLWRNTGPLESAQSPIIHKDKQSPRQKRLGQSGKGSSSWQHPPPSQSIPANEAGAGGPGLGFLSRGISWCSHSLPAGPQHMKEPSAFLMQTQASARL